ncbi:MAG: BREX-1 system adenine-specific DNA-methyltransferase PglX [Oscillibacter sp.]|nr:BREX-1 system adenine-specific DNA-methyltransferase PglX [Oscillibacter sp.]
MNKAAIKNFAMAAREKLIQDARYQAGLLGVTAEGITDGRTVDGAELYDIGGGQSLTIQGTRAEQRRHFVQDIRRRAADSDYATAYRYVMEEVAYTWFNRLIAIRFMEVNGYLESRVLSSEGGKTEPEIVAAPFESGLEFDEAEREQIAQLKAANRVQETDILFRMLFRKQCNALNEILPGLFSRTDSPGSYEELLLSLSCNDPEGVVRNLVDGIPEADFDIERGGQVEILGWLYQYYNTEPKAEAFAKKGRITKDELPAVTQLFTPDWIVRYMTENSVGRLWTDARPGTVCRADWKYYLDEAEQTPGVQAQLDAIRRERADLNPDEIKILDPCMGSGHILVYAFDVLMQIYRDAGWNRRDAARSIVKNNLYGLDIDKRAYQLSYFALMMKAREYDRNFLSRGVQPNLAYIQESNDILSFPLDDFGWTFPEADKARAQLETLLAEMKHAREYGSLVRPTPRDWTLLDEFILSGTNWGQSDSDTLDYEYAQEKVRALLKIAAILSQQYDAVITNPPYMGGANMSGRLSEFVKKHYPEGKADLFACFIERCLQFVRERGYVAMITQHAWMFLSSFEKLRGKLRLVDTVNMAHLGARAFEEIGGEVVQTTSFAMRRAHIAGYAGTYCRLLDPKTQNGKAEMFLAGINRYFAVQDNFSKIPGAPVAYWIGDNVRNLFTGTLIKNFTLSDGQNKTGNNEKFMRNWWEIFSEYVGKGKRWVLCARGGIYRRWYGNINETIDWSESARNHYRKDHVARIIPHHVRYQEGFTWNRITSYKPSYRIQKSDMLFEMTGLVLFWKDNSPREYILGFLNSKPAEYLLRILTQVMTIQLRDVQSLPLIFSESYEQAVKELVSNNIALCKSDWDAFETSWDFQRHPLLPERDENQEGESSL